MGRQGVLQELPGGAALFAAGAQNRPYPYVPLSAHPRAAAFGSPAVNHCGADASLSGIVRRRNGWVEEEPEDSLPVLGQPLGQGSGLGAFADGVRLSQSEDAAYDAITAIFGRLDDIRRRRFGRIGRVLGEPGDLFGQLGHLGEKLGNLFLQLCDPLQIELLPGRFHRPLHLGLLAVGSIIGRTQPSA